MNETQKSSAHAKKPYSPPRLTTYGSLKDIVKGGSGGHSDGAPGDTKMCWIAEAVYGPVDPRTLLVRHWLTAIYDGRRSGWPMVAMYRRFGRTAAAVVRYSAMVRRLLRPLFDRLVQRACSEIVSLAKAESDSFH